MTSAQVCYGTDDLDFALKLCEDRAIRADACTNAFVVEATDRFNAEKYLVIFEGAKNADEITQHIDRVRGKGVDLTPNDRLALTPRNIADCVRLAQAAERQIQDEHNGLPFDGWTGVRYGILHAFLMVVEDEYKCAEFERGLCEVWPETLQANDLTEFRRGEVDPDPLNDPALNPETDR